MAAGRNVRASTMEGNIRNFCKRASAMRKEIELINIHGNTSNGNWRIVMSDKTGIATSNDSLLPRYVWVCVGAQRRIKASYTSSSRPHTVVAQGLIH